MCIFIKARSLNEGLLCLVQATRKWGEGADYADDVAVLSLEITQVDTSDSVVNSPFAESLARA